MQVGAYGGANQFGITLERYLTSRGVTVIHDLTVPDIDLVLITDTRPWLKSCTFAGTAVARYLKEHPHTKVIFRVNECDQKRGTTFKILNHLIAEHAALADHVIYISHWLRTLFEKQYPALTEKSSVIHNGADTSIFNSHGYRRWNGSEPLRLVTHHWSSNRYKGLDVYQHLDKLLGTAFKDKLTFTFIGNPSVKAAFSHIKVLPPLSDIALAAEIQSHHVYLTASLFEPAGMHHIEGALCGLPLLYRQSGALPEYCHGFGVPFTGPADIAEAVTTMFTQYSSLASRMPEYTHTADRMCDEYYQLIMDMVKMPSVARRRSAGMLQLTSQALFAKETALNLLRSYS